LRKSFEQNNGAIFIISKVSMGPIF